MDCPKLKVQIVTARGTVYHSDNVRTWKGLQEKQRKALELLEEASFTEDWTIQVKRR